MCPAAGDVFLPVEEFADRLAIKVRFRDIARFFFKKLSETLRRAVSLAGIAVLLTDWLSSLSQIKGPARL
jgi:hypothetical protein